MTRLLTPAVLFAAAILAVLAVVVPVRAEVRVVESEIENAYPNALHFHLVVEADDEVTDVTLRYSITGRNVSGFGKPDDFSAGSNIDVSVELRVNSSNSYIPVASEFTYFWEITTADGEVTTTPEQEFVYLPPNREWRSVESDIMRVYFHGNRESLARQYLEAGEETYQAIAVDLLQTELPVTPVKVVLFATSEEMAPARQGRGETFDEAVRTCGTKLTVDIVFVIPVSCGTPDVTDTLRHEFGHIINQAAGEGPIGRLPSWIDEGAAVFAQTEPGSNFEGAFRAAVRADRLIPFNQMGTPSNDPRAVNLFYGQSWAMVTYLIERDGPEEFSRFFATMRRGERFDRALEEVYGFTLAGFEDEFREAHGLQPRGAPQQEEPTAQPGQQQTEPTPAPTRAPLSTTGTTGSSGGVDRITIGIIGAAVLFALLGIFFYLLGSMAASNRRAVAGGAPSQGDAPWQRPPQEREDHRLIGDDPHRDDG